MALGFFQHDAAGRAVAWPGGSEPGSRGAGQDVAAVRPIRDEIEQRVLALLEELGVPSQDTAASHTRG